jgi:hypothetical protein
LILIDTLGGLYFMSGGARVKRAGTSAEYAVANWFCKRENWEAKRNILSGASQQFCETVSKHDCRAWHKTLPIFLQIEVKKKTGIGNKPNEIIVQNEWIEKIDFSKDELLVISTNRSPLWAFLPADRYFQILGRKYNVEYTSNQIFKGKSQFLFKREYIENCDNKFHLLWDNKPYIVLLLEDFVMLRETANINDNLTMEEQIIRLNSLEKAIQFEQLNQSLTYHEKSLLYNKMDQLDQGIFTNPIAKADQQWWLSDDQKYILTCPHCKQQVTKQDLTSKNE